MSSNRNQVVDILRGIGILCVVIGHCYFLAYDSLELAVIYSFHMPLFILVSGYLFKEAPLSKEFVSKKIESILVPYFIIAFFSMFTVLPSSDKPVVSFLVDIFVGNALDGRLSYNVALWFLPMLFLSTVAFALTYTLADRTKRRTLVFCIGAVALSAFGYYLMHDQNERLVWNLEIALFVQAFMLIGYLFRKAEERYAGRCSTPMRILLCLAALILWGIGVYWNRRVDLNGRKVGNVFVYFVAAISAVYFLYEIAKYILVRLRPIAWFLSWCGENSLYIMALYLPVSAIVYNGLHEYLPTLWNGMVWEQNVFGIVYILFYDILIIALLRKVFRIHRTAEKIGRSNWIEKTHM